MDTWIYLNNQTAGKDKLARLVQYFARSVWGALEQRDSSPLATDQLKTLEYILSSFRKLLRLGKCFEVFHQALKTIHYPDLIIKVTLTLSKLGQALFLLCDHLVWISRTGLTRTVDSKRWTEQSNKYWLLSIIMNLARDLYEIFHLLEVHSNARHSGITRGLSLRSSRDLGRLVRHSYACLLCHKDVMLDTVKNLCDIFIPLTALGYTKLSPRTVGLLGVLSSIAGLMALIEPKAKLLPA